MNPTTRGSQPGAPRAAESAAREQFDVGSECARFPGGDHRWKLYVEKCLSQPTSAYIGKDGAEWLLSLRNYLAGRTAELDRLFDYLEKSSDEVGNDIAWMLQCSSNEKVS